MLRMLWLLLLATALANGSAFLHGGKNRLSRFSLRSTPPGAYTDSTPHMASTNPPKVLSLSTVEDFLNYLDNAPKGSLSVVKFFAKTCPLCRKIDIKYKKMTRTYENAPIRFAEIDKAVHQDFCTLLGVNKFPFIQIYRNGQCVASHGVDSDTTFDPLVNDTISRELSMSAEDWESFLTAFAQPIHQSAERIEKVRLLTKH